MANEYQLRILRQGVVAWNEWRIKNPDAKVDLRGSDFIDANLMTANLDNVDLSGANLTGADLSKAGLLGCKPQWNEPL